MAKSRRALGRGLSHLIPTNDESVEASENNIAPIDVKTIRPNPFQPRTDFDDEEIRNLADSIKNQGLLQPIVVRKLVDGFEIISGERRFRAITLLGNQQAPCIVREKVSDREMLELALVENIQREDLNEIEKAQAYQKLLLECDHSHDQLAQRIGKSRSAITNALRLLKLPEKIQGMVRKGRLSMGHARALLSVESADRQLQLAERTIEEKLSVREIENASRQSASAPKAKRVAPKNAAKIMREDPNLEAVIEKLKYRFGAPVAVRSAADGGGKIEIPYYSGDDLNRILQILGVV